MKLKFSFHRKSLFNRFIIPIIFVMVIETIALFFVVFDGGTVQELNNNSVSRFKADVTLRSTQIENTMNSTWSSIIDVAESIETDIDKYIDDNNLNAETLLADDSKSIEAMSGVSNYMIDILNRNKVTDSYLILNNDSDEDKLCIYLRRPHPQNTFVYSNITVEIAPTSIRDSYFSLLLDRSFNYEPRLDINSLSSPDFFKKPLDMGIANDKEVREYLGYWSMSSSIHYNTGNCVLTYSIPLFSADDTVLGVLGIGITAEYLNSFFLNEQSLDSSSSVMMLFETENKLKIVSYENSSGVIFNDENINTLKPNGFEDIYDITLDDQLYHLYRSNLSLYNSNTPYETAEKWYIASSVSHDYLFGFVRSTMNTLTVILIALVILSIIFVLFYCYMFIIRPIKKATVRISEGDVNVVDNYNVGIYEIDVLNQKIKALYHQSFEASTRLSLALSEADVPVAVFTISKSLNSFFASEQFYEFFDVTPLEGNDVAVVKKFFEDMHKYLIEATPTEGVYCLNNSNKKKYLHIKIVEKESDLYGFVIDITKEREELHRLEKERNIDVLTGLLNRRGFENSIKTILKDEEVINNSALIMIDIDHLKETNDLYGHEAGDTYLIQIALSMQNIVSKKNNSIVGHLSGDEFLIFLYGYETKEALQDEIFELQKLFSNTVIKINDLLELPLSLSAGVVFYEKFIVDDYITLKRYADFAMYEAKQLHGHCIFNLFDISRYEIKQKKIRDLELLKYLLLKEDIDYHFQPIVCLKTGNIIGYEALMRPEVKELASPEYVLNLAKDNGLLGKVHRTTMFGACRKFISYYSDKLIFINSVSSEVLNVEDRERFFKEFISITNQIVIEFTEGEKLGGEILDQKLEFINKYNLKCAIDDYGSGYSNVDTLLKISPTYLKIDRSLIVNIYKNKKSSDLVATILNFCHRNNIFVVAEGIESAEELEYLINIGVDYAQGYFLARPTPNLSAVSQNALDIIKK